MNPTEEPAAVVQRQLEAYNRRNLEALLATYAADAELYQHPSMLLACGTDALRERFSVRFREPDLHATLMCRVVMGAIVVDHEQVTRNLPEGRRTLEFVMIYEVHRGRIARSWSLPRMPGL